MGRIAHQDQEEQVRLNLLLSKKARDSLEALRERVDAGSYSEVVREALALYDLIADLRDEGSKVVIRRKDGSEERLVVLL